MTTLFALATPDNSTPPRLQYLARTATAGNLMRTLQPASALTWANEAEVVAWVDRLPEWARNQIADEIDRSGALPIGPSGDPIRTARAGSTDPSRIARSRTARATAGAASC